ncbi:MAG: hypothetical protein LBD58_01135 [Treponema sp.]|nr:hypothetical protein [Treponema sp.]
MGTRTLAAQGGDRRHEGIKKKAAAVNFDSFANELIALTGANGKDKTTLIKNCHLYPQLLTRMGKLQDHFFLKDSLREIVYRNRVDGSMRKFLIQIDGQNKSGACKYFIFRRTAGLAAAEKVKVEAAKTHNAEIKIQVLQSAIDKKLEEEKTLKDTDAALKIKNVELADVAGRSEATKAAVERLQTAWNAEQIRR